MASREYASTDASAPTCTGEVGSLNNLLNKVLVTGYGTQPAAGWTKPYETSNIAVFMTGDGQACLQVNDAGPGVGTYKEARVRGYEAMSAYNTGTGPFPTAAQQTNGGFARKSAAADNTQRVWYCWANSNTFYLAVETGDSASNPFFLAFGRFTADKPNDKYAYFIAARYTENSAGVSAETLNTRQISIGTAGANKLYIPRSVQGVAGAVQAEMHSDLVKSKQAQTSGTDGVAYPDPATGGLRLERTYIHELNQPRGFLPGLWTPLHARPLAHAATITGTDNLINRTFRAQNHYSSGQTLFETSNTWDT